MVNLTPQVEKLDKLPEIQKGQEITLSLLREYRELQRPISMLLTHQGQREYFKRYYQTFESQLSFLSPRKILLFMIWLVLIKQQQLITREQTAHQ